MGGQETKLRQDVAERGFSVYRVYRDGGVSGAAADRTALSELMADARAGRFEEVLVWSVSRLSRNLSFLLTVMEELEQLGIRFPSLSESFDPATPDGKFILSALGAIAEMQRESWMEASRIGMEQRVRSGRWNGGTVLGYESVPDPSDPRGGTRLEIVPEEAALVRQIFEMYAEGLGYKAIINRLGEGRKTGKNGKAFSTSTLSLILKNPLYIGKVRHGDIMATGIHTPIIDEALWQSVQETLQARSKPPQKTVATGGWLSGILRCPECGAPMTPGHTKNKCKDGSFRTNHYYGCNAYANRGKTACHANNVPAKAAEETVEAWLLKYLANPFWVKRVAETIRKQQEESSAPVLAEKTLAEAQMAELDKEKEKGLERFENGKISKNELIQLMQRIRSDREAVERRLEDVRARSAHLPGLIELTDVKAAFASFRQMFRKAKLDKKKDLAKSLIAFVRVNADKEVIGMELKVPMLEEAGGQEQIVVDLT